MTRQKQKAEIGKQKSADWPVLFCFILSIFCFSPSCSTAPRTAPEVQLNPMIKPPTAQSVPSSSAPIPTPSGSPQIVNLAWDDSISPSVAGYKLYSGPASRTYTTSQDLGKTLTASAMRPARGVTYFAVTAYTTTGLESDFSNEISRGARPTSERVPFGSRQTQ